MCIECSNLLIETLHPHEVPPGPWVKIGIDFFQDHHGKKHLIVADYFSKFPYIFPVASAHHFKTINHLRELFTTEGIPTIVMSDNGPPFNGDEFKWFAHKFDFIHTTWSPHFHQSNGFIKAMVKKVKNAYNKTDGSPNAQARALLQLQDTTISIDLPSPTEILHGWPAQGAVTSRPSILINIHPICQRLIEMQNTQKEQFDRAHRAKDLWVLKVNEQVQFFPNKQGTGMPTWLTGTVTEIFDCGHSYMIQGPNGRVYRRNRAHLKPICYDGTSFQDHPVKKEEMQPKINPFQDPEPTKVKNVSFQMDSSYMDARSMLFDEPNIHQTPPHHLHQHLSSYTHPGHHHFHPLHLYHQENHQLSPAQRTLHLQAGRDISLNQPSSDPMTLTEDSHLDFQLYCRKRHPYHHTNWRDQPKQEPESLSAQCIELLSRPFRGKLEIGSFRTILHSEFQTPFKTPALHYTVFSFSMGNTLQTNSVKSPWETTLRNLVLSGPFHTENFGLNLRPLRIIHHIQWMDSFQDHWEEENYTEHITVQF